MKNLNKNIKKIWLSYYLLVFIITFCILFLISILFFEYLNTYYNLYCVIVSIILISYIIIVPIILKISYSRYKYIINLNKIEFSHGIIFIKTIIIPFNKIQHIIIKQNPINKIFNLKTIKFVTANKSYSIQGLSNNEIIKIYEYIKKI